MRTSFTNLNNRSGGGVPMINGRLAAPFPLYVIQEEVLR
jgi:hypothetical protein